MEATCSSETSIEFQRTTRRCIPEDRSLQNHRYEIFKSYLFLLRSTTCGSQVSMNPLEGYSILSTHNTYIKFVQLHQNQ
jgi:hypothetical protein